MKRFLKREQVMGRRLILGIIVALFGCIRVDAGMVTTNEAEMDAVFSQASFTDPIDIRFLAQQTIFDSTLLVIDDGAELSALFNHPTNDPTPTINMFFVDAIQWCGGPASPGFTIAGCANTPGNDLVLNSNFAAGSSGAELAAHEIAHNLGLGHVGNTSSTDNLMNPVLNGNTDLTVAQYNSLITSSRVQMDGSGMFINIRPILIAASVPEPTAATMFVVAMIGVSVRRRRV
jgi:hypothetical protein